MPLLYPADPRFPTPESSEAAERSALGPRQVKDACFTYVRPDGSEKNPELLAVSPAGLDTIGLRHDVVNDEEFRKLVAGNKYYMEHYPWAQAYGGELGVLRLCLLVYDR